MQYRSLLGKRGRKRTLGRPRYRGEDDIKTDLENQDGMGALDTYGAV